MLTIIEFPVPDVVDDAWRDYLRISRAHNHELIGGPQWDMSDEATLAAAHADEEHVSRHYLAYVDGEAVGYARTRQHLFDSPENINYFVCVLPEHRGRGIGAALVSRLDADCPGYAVYQAWTDMPAPAADEEALSPPSGVGRVPANHPAIRLALASGFRLGQVERVSRYDFAAPLVDPAEAMAESAAHAGDDYEVVAWEGAADDAMLADLARLRELMYTDIPSGAMTTTESTWDAERMRRGDEERLVTNRMFRTVVRHLPSGAVVALNELMVDRSNPEAFVDQWDTVVAPEHRGHRLGMLVKAANIIQVREAIPSAETIMTWNAEENRHMLNVNEALGFRPVLVEAALERKGGPA